MTTNPDSIVRVRARNGGRASVYEANAWAQSFSTGVMDGAGVRQNTSADMNVLVGGTTTNPDVVIASNPAGYKIALDIVGTHTVAITAPASNKRIASVVAYTDDLSIVSTETSVTGSPASCGLIVVNGDTSSSPVAPTDAMIRAAITADGATGTQASYAVIANVAVDSSTSMVTDSLITNLRSGVTADKIDWATIAYVLYEGDTSGTITLSDNASNYDYFDVWFKTNDGAYGTVRVFETGVDFQMISIKQYDSEGATQRIKLGGGNINGTQLTRSNYRQIDIRGESVAAEVWSYPVNAVSIKKVVGYKTTKA